MLWLVKIIVNVLLPVASAFGPIGSGAIALSASAEAVTIVPNIRKFDVDLGDESALFLNFLFLILFKHVQLLQLGSRSCCKSIAVV